MSSKENQKYIINDAITKEIIEAVTGLKYGHIHIIVHNSKIVQIDKTEKIRLDSGTIGKGGSV